MDLDVLSDIPETPKPPKKERKVRLADSESDGGTRQKTKPARKPAEEKTQRNQPPKKAPAVKYQVKETEKPDEHDKLKPRANPVPVVKVLKSTTSEQPKTETAAEPEVSKRFLEQQTQQGTETAVEAVSVVETAAAPSVTEQAPSVPETPVVKTIVRRSVFPVDEKLGRKGRSLVLSKEVPADSATARAVERGQTLYDIFLFEDRSADLTDEMRLELSAVAEEMQKMPKRRILLLSYSGSTAPERGRERQLSLRRALTVRSALTRLGIRSLRIELRSQGLKGSGEKLPNRVDILFDD